jgi:hypothetical protein
MVAAILLRRGYEDPAQGEGHPEGDIQDPMIQAIPEPIGILACPGGAVFAQRMISDLEDLSGRKFRRKVELLAERYGMPKEEIIRHINLHLDLHPTSVDLTQATASPTGSSRPRS